MSNNVRFFIGMFILFILLALVLISCEKTIDVDLDSVEPQLVIEAPLQEGDHVFRVSISRTADYFDNNQSITIENAVVTLIGPNSSTSVLPMGNGEYQAEVNAIGESIYELQIDIDGTLYKATSYLPQKVELNEIEVEFEEGNPRFDEGYITYFRFQDPADQLNYYRFLYSLNGVPQNTAEDLSVLDDRILNGSYARRPLFQERFQSGDEVTLILRHFDEDSYDYFNSLADIVGGGGGPAGGVAAPGNPNSNWSNGALGYFSAFSDDTLSIIIP